jgi:hypothetical protein
MIIAYAADNALVRGTIENLGTPGQQRVVVACYAPLAEAYRSVRCGDRAVSPQASAASGRASDSSSPSGSIGWR